MRRPTAVIADIGSTYAASLVARRSSLVAAARTRLRASTGTTCATTGVRHAGHVGAAAATAQRRRHSSHVTWPHGTSTTGGSASSRHTAHESVINRRVSRRSSTSASPSPTNERTSTSRAVSPTEDAVLELLTKRRAAPPPAADDAAATSTVLPADVAYIRERAAAVFASTRASVAASVRTARANADACRDAALLAAELATPTRSAALADELVLVAIGLARYVDALLAVLLAEPHVTLATLATYTRILGPERARDALLVLDSIARAPDVGAQPSSPPAHEALVAVLVGASPNVWSAASAAATLAGTDELISASSFAMALRRGLIDVSLATMLHVASIEA